MRRYYLLFFLILFSRFIDTSWSLETQDIISRPICYGLVSPYAVASLVTSVARITKESFKNKLLLNKTRLQFIQGTSSNKDNEADTLCTLHTAIKITKNIDCYGATLEAVSTEDQELSYQWSTGASKAVISGLYANKYSVTVTNASACRAIDSITLTDQSPLSVNIKEFLGVTCYGKKDGLLIASTKGGRAPYSYQWSTVDTSQQLKNVGAGLYAVTVSDANKCTAKDQIKVQNPDSLAVDIVAVDTGKLEAIETGGQEPYTYQWSVNANSVTTKVATGLNPDLYSVTMTDAFGCYSKASLTLNIKDVFDLNRLNSTIIWPNPNRGVVHILLADIYEERLSWRLVNTVGQIVQNGTLEGHKQKYQINLHAKLLNGYYYFVFDDNVEESYLRLRVTR